MYKVYKNNIEICEVEHIVQNGAMWSFENDNGINIEQKLVTTNINDYLIKDENDNVVNLSKELTIEEQQQEIINALGQELTMLKIQLIMGGVI